MERREWRDERGETRVEGQRTKVKSGETRVERRGGKLIDKKCGVSSRDEVIVRSFTFCASSHPVTYQ